MGDLVPFRSPTPVPTGRALPRAVRTPRTPARRDFGSARGTPNLSQTPAAARGPIGFLYALVEMQRQIGRRKRAERAQLVARLEAEYQRRQRLALAAKPLELNP